MKGLVLIKGFLVNDISVFVATSKPIKDIEQIEVFELIIVDKVELKC